MHTWTAFLIFAAITIKSSYGTVEDCRIADIAFVMDSSSSIYGPDFNKSKDFLESIVQSLDVGPDGTHIAALTFGRHVYQEFTFNDYKDADKDKISYRISQITHKIGDQTHTHKALQSMMDDLFSEKTGARPNVPHICVVVTDGKSTYDKKTLEVATAAKKAGITILAIGVGDKVDEDEIKAIASDPAKDNAIFTDSYTALINATFQNAVIDQTCVVTKTTTVAPPTTTTQKKTTTTVTEAPTTTTEKITTTTEKITTTPKPIIDEETIKQCQGKEVDVLFVLDQSTSIWDVDFKRQQQFVSDVVSRFDVDSGKTRFLGRRLQGKEVDVLFVLDQSTSIWDVDFKRQQQFVSDVVSRFDVDSGKTRVGMILFSDYPEVGFNFDAYKTNKEIRTEVKSVNKSGGITNTHLALNAALDLFSPDHGSRPGVAHIAIVITDGISRIPKDTIAAAKKMHDKGIYVFTIGVGNMTDRNELEQMATDQSFCYAVEAYKVLPKLMTTLAFKTCKVPADKEKCLKDASAQIMFGMFGIGGDQRNGVSDLIRRVVEGFNLGSGKVSVGMEEVCNSTQMDVQAYSSNEEFFGEMNSKTRYEMSDMIVNIRYSFRRKMPKGKKRHVTILLVSGKADDNLKAINETKRLTYKSDVIVVNVGDFSGFEGISKELKRVTEFSINDKNGYPYVSKRILSLICKGQ